tara:strand:- start:427 stop:1677 length:1251 start_codon:yes stop_codon:yes gene_type:complete
MATNYDNIHRSGLRDGSSDARSLFLKLYAGEVLTAFQSRNIMMPLHRVRTISKGKSAQFPMTGKYRDASYHTPGKEIVPTTSKQGERIVSIDDLLVNAQFIPNIDEAMSHFDIRSIYTQEAGFGLSKVADQNILRLAIKAALCEDATMANLSGGGPKMIQDYTAFDHEDFTQNVVIGASAGTDSDKANGRKSQKVAQAIMDAKRILTNADVPGDPFIVLANDVYFDMFKIDQTDAINSLAIFNRDIGGGGSPIAGAVPQILGMPVYVTNHLGSYDSTADDATWSSDLWSITNNIGQHKTSPNPDWGSDQPLAATVGSGRTTQYDTPNNSHTAWKTTEVTNTGANAAARKTAHVSAVANRVCGLVMTQDAVATAKLMDMSVESEYQINRQGTLMVAKYAMGHNVLRPACAVALITPL